jgi:nucleoside-diphosphate-sugar epimerase
MAFDAVTSARRHLYEYIFAGVILITGASGRVARRTAELLARGGHSLRLMTRTPRHAPKLTGAETVCVDFAEPATSEPLTGTRFRPLSVRA